jgi:glycosyltransferase involved in cell wall biosynthesis
VIVITHNEERNLARCLASVQWAAERIVVDADSTDRTRQVASTLGAHVFQRPWSGYGPQKNFGIEQATQPWILSIDADEEVPPALALEIQQVASAVGIAPGAYRLHRPTFFLGKPLGHYGRATNDPGFIRLFRKDAGRFDSRLVHETVQVRATVGWLEHPLLHHSYPNLASYWTKIHRYARLEGRERAGRPAAWGNRWVRAAGKLAWMLVVRRGILDGPPAWVWIAGQAYQEWLTV